MKRTLVLALVISLLLPLSYSFAAAGPISKISVAISGTNATIYWLSTAPTPSLVYYGTSPGVSGLSKTAENPTPVSFHAVLLTNLSPGATYYFHIATQSSRSKEDFALYSSFKTTGTAPVTSTPTPTGQSATGSVGTGLVFTRAFGLGDTDPQIKILQTFLNADLRTLVAVTGPGSRGQETSTFGPATKRALIKFQELYAQEILAPNGLTYGTGTLGPSTRVKLNQLATAQTKAPTAAVAAKPIVSTPSYGVGGSGSSGGSSSGAMPFIPAQPIAPQTPAPTTGSGSQSSSPAAPSTPASLSSSVVSTSALSLSWAAVGGATSYVLERSTSQSSGYSSIGGTLTTTSYSDSGLSSATRYYYRVKARNATGDSAYSTVTYATTQSAPVVTPPVVVAPPAVTPIGRGENSECSDGIDNDGDGLVDFADNKGSSQGGAGVYGGCFINLQETSTDYGWTLLVPSSDTQIIYVSSSGGDDASDGLTPTTAKKTTAAGYAALRDGYPDWLLLKAGDSWQSDEFAANVGYGKSGRSDAAKLVVSRYGSGANPRLIYMKYWSGNSGNIALMNLNFDVLNPTDDFVWSGLRFGNSYSNVLIEGDNFARGGINIQYFNNFKIRRTTVVDSWGSGQGGLGAYLDNINGLLVEESLFDLNGWLPGVIERSWFTHNIYIQADCSNVIVRNNIFARGSGESQMQRPGGITDNNLYLKSPLGLTVGYYEDNHSWPYVSSRITNNVFLDAVDIFAGGARGAAISIAHKPGVKDVLISGNVIAHKTEATLGYAIGFSGSTENVTIENNIIYEWEGVSDSPDDTYGIQLSREISGTPGSTQIRNNTIQLTKGRLINGSGPTQVAFSGNTYYRGGANLTDHFENGRISDAGWYSIEPNANFARPQYLDPNRDIKTYMSSVGGTPTLEAFLAQARLQTRANWRNTFTSSAVNNYIRAGFAKTGADIATSLPENARPSTQPIARYTFDDTAADQAGSGHNGTLSGGPIYADGKIGKALAFDGVDDIVTIPSISIPGDISVSAWVYSTNFNQDGGYVVLKNPVNQQWALFFEGGFLKWRGMTPGGGAATCTAPASNAWHHVAVTQSGTGALLYIDGVDCTISPAWNNVAAIGNGSGSISIGAFEGPGYPFQGSIDDVRIYNRVLSTSEISTLYQNGSSGVGARIQSSYFASVLEQSLKKVFDFLALGIFRRH